MEKVLKEAYKLQHFHSKKMEGYGSHNYKITGNDHNYVLKVYPDSADETDWLNAENLVLKRLSKEDETKYPQPIANTSQDCLTIEKQDEISTAYRLLSFVEGAFFSTVDHTELLYFSLGEFLARMDESLLGFSHPAIKARKIPWDLQYFLTNEQFIPAISNHQDAKIVKYFVLQFKQQVLPSIDHLRKSTIHNDANDQNLLTQNGKVSGIIDFGDMVYGPLICEIAVALAYALMGKEETIKWTIPILKGYHKTIKLESKEIDVLYYLVAARLCTSVCNSAYHKIKHPESEYITISEKPAWELLKKWLTINPVDFSHKIKDALAIDYSKASNIEQLLDKRHTFISSSLSVSYKAPIYMDRAAFQYMYDAYGNTYLDAYNNIPHVGHQHPDVVEAGQRQMSQLNTNTRYVYEGLGQYAEALINKFPNPLRRVFFVNSGSAASDLAIRLALNYSQHQQIMVMEHGYHGNTRVGIDISHYKYTSQGGRGKVNNIIEAKLPDVYRQATHYPIDEIGVNMANEALRSANGQSIAAFIAEPIVGCGGQVPLAPGYLKQMYDDIRKQGGVCISDEVQTGFGRVGETFWGYEMHDVVPDIVVLGKPMGNGHPIGAVITTPDIADAFDNGMEFFSSFGGNPVSCAIGMEVLNVIHREKLQQNAKKQGNYFKDELHQIAQKFECIGDIRGQGLFLGIEFVKDRQLKTPNTEVAQYLKNKLRENHILVSTDGPHDNVIKMKPPLCFNQQNINQVIHEMERCLHLKM